MIRKLTLTAVTLSVAFGALVSTATAAHAAKPTVTAGPGSSVSCNITAKGKLSVKLQNNWVQADHAADPDPLVAAVPNTDFAGAPVPVTTSVKAGGACTGTVTDGVNTIPVDSVKVSMSTTSTGLDAPTCPSLLGMVNGSTYFDATVSFKSTGGKVTSTTVHALIGILLDAHGFGFTVTADPTTTGSTISGSFAGGSNVFSGYVGQALVDAVTAPIATSLSPVALSPCEASLNIKNPGTPKEKVSLKKPKGFKKIEFGPSSIDSTPSTDVFTG
jgi:hypothetical protein